MKEHTIIDKLFQFFLDVLPVSISKRIKPDYNRPEKGDWIASFVRLIFFILSVQYFIVRPYMVPTGSMNHTIENNDFLLVNRFIYGLKTPDNLSIPFTNVFFKREIPTLQFTPSLNEINSNDIIVFRADHEEPPVEYVKRCVAAAGDSIKVVNGVIYVNNVPFINADASVLPVKSEFEPDTLPGLPSKTDLLLSSIINGNTAGESFSVSLGSAKDFPDSKSNDEILKDFIEYSMTFTAVVKKDFFDYPELRNAFNVAIDRVKYMRKSSSNYITNISYEDALADVVRNYYGSRNFAHITNPHNFKTIYVPKKGDVLYFKDHHFDVISNVIFFDGHKLNIKNGKFLIDGEEAESYTVEQDFYFVIGDNRTNSLDSRNWGFVPRKFISGAPILIYFSLTEKYTQGSKPFTYYLFNLFDNIRYERIGQLIL